VLFRCNGSAVLLTNRSCDVPRAKYTIQHIVRTNLAADDTAYNCVMQVGLSQGSNSSCTTIEWHSFQIKVPQMLP
jgi:hypothetical protein